MAWVVVGYRFTGRRLIDGLIEFPFALPTAAAGIALTFLTNNKGWIGEPLSKLRISVAHARVGIVVALVFVALPFVVRSIQPILEELAPDCEEAGRRLGAGSFTIFFKIVFPEIKPALMTGFALAFARGLGEYGSAIFIAGDKPFQAEIAPLTIVTRLEKFWYGQATAVALFMLLASFVIMFTVDRVQIRVASLVGD